MFPIQVQYINGKIEVVNNVDDLENGVPFKILATDVFEPLPGAVFEIEEKLFAFLQQLMYLPEGAMIYRHDLGRWSDVTAHNQQMTDVDFSEEDYEMWSGVKISI
jgi:hypothetical protein